MVVLLRQSLHVLGREVASGARDGRRGRLDDLHPRDGPPIPRRVAWLSVTPRRLRRTAVQTWTRWERTPLLGVAPIFRDKLTVVEEDDSTRT